MNLPRYPSHARRWIVIMCVVILAGCGQPIYDGVSFQPMVNGISLTADADPANYQWPLTRDGYVVAKPPPMAFVTSFGEPLTRPDPLTAELVPWSEEGLDDRAKQLLREAYAPIPEQPDRALLLDRDQFAGSQAFDVSVDSSRLIVLSGNKLTLYRTDDGSLVGHLPLPKEIASTTPRMTAVRFCGTSKDMLVASEKQIFRISGSDKSVVARSASCGEAIAQWIVNDDDKSMLMRSESGKLFGGDPNLEVFTAYDVGSNLAFDACGLSADGRRIGVVANNRARVYTVDQFQIIDQHDHADVGFNPQVAIAMGISTDAWVDGDGIFYSNPLEEKPTTNAYRMFWQPLMVSACYRDPRVNWFVTVGRRMVDGSAQYVLFDLGANSRNHSFPTPLPELPERIAHGIGGTRVAVSDSSGLHLYRRDEYRSPEPIYLSQWTYDWVDADEIETIERLLSIFKSQTRLGYGVTSESIRGRIISEIASRWRYLQQNQPDDEILARLESWLAEGSQLALVASAIRHYQLGWRARGDGFASTVSEEGFETYGKHIELAKQQLDRAIELGDPPLQALKFRIEAGLESDESLEEVDPLCRLACAAYPGEYDPHISLMFKLLPRWFGEQGDTLAHANYAAKMLEEPEASLLYFQLVCPVPRYIPLDDVQAWKSYDPHRVRRGLDEFIRRGMTAGDDMYFFWAQLNRRTHDRATGDRLLAYLMEHEAAPPHELTHGKLRYESPALYLAVERLRGNPVP